MERWSKNNELKLARNACLKFLKLVVIVIVVLIFGTVTGGGQAQVDEPHRANANIIKEQLPYCADQQQQDSKRSPSGSIPSDRFQQASTSGNLINRSAILVSTIDGRITALNVADGTILWSHATKPDSLLASTLDNLKLTNDGKRMHLVPSLDGDLYTFDGERMGAIPLSMDALLSNSMRVADDTVVTGGKEISTYGIERSTGRLKYACGTDGCHQFHESPGKIDDSNEDEDVVVVRRLTKTVRAISARTGLEKWNYSVGLHEVSLASSPLNEGCHDNVRVAEQEIPNIKFMATEGVVLALGAKGTYNWKRELDVPIVHAWQLIDQSMEPLDLFEDEWNVRDTSADLRPILHFGMYNKQLYVVQSRKLRGALQLEWDTFKTKTYPTVTWNPYLISANSRTPIIFGSSSPKQLELIGHQQPSREDKGNTALVARLEDAEYPYDSGFTLYTNEMSLESSSSNSGGRKPATAANTSAMEEQEAEPETLDQIIIVSLWYWWKEVLIISISFAALTNLCITRHVLHRMKDKFLNERSPETVVVQPTTPSVSTAVPSKESTTVGELSSSENRNSSESMSTPPVDFVSRYATDFEPIQRLGKGGFGVVVQARNKLDDCDYAIKRICMPNKSDRKARIMREVKALAKLDHVGIVRYYNAWLECPPSDWQDTHFTTADQDVFTPSSSMTSEVLHSLFGQRVLQQQGTSNVDHVSSWSKPTARRQSVNNNNNNNSDEKSFTISLPPRRTSAKDTSDDSLNIVFEDSGCDSAELAQKRSFGESSSSYVQFRDSASSRVEPNRVPSNDPKVVAEAPTTTTKRFVWDKPEKLYLYIQMQLCRKDNLKDWLSFHKDSRDKFEVLDYFHQIVGAVEYVHEQGLIHRDLKPSNIFFAQGGSIKVGDFGLAASTTPEASWIAASTPDRGRPLSTGTRHTDQVGTGLYMSPEQVAEKEYDHKVDIFSLGLVFFEMLVPFGTAMERVKVMMDARQLEFPPNFVEYSPNEFELVSQLLAQLPQDRPSASEIKQHPLFQDFQPRPELLRRHRRSRNVSRSYSTSSSSESGSGSGSLGIIFDKDFSAAEV